MRVLALAAMLAACGNGSATRDASTPLPIDARAGADGAPGVACLGADCAPGVACCREVLVPGQASTFCIDAVLCEGAIFECDGPEDCDGGVCCAGDDGRVTCSDVCAGLRTCHTDRDCPGTACCDTPFRVVATCCGS